MEAGGSTNNHRTMFQSQTQSIAGEQNSKAIAFGSSVSDFLRRPFFLNLADACRSPVPRSVTSPRRRRRARSHAEKLALHGLDSSARDDEASVPDSCSYNEASLAEHAGAHSCRQAAPVGGRPVAMPSCHGNIFFPSAPSAVRPCGRPCARHKQGQ